MNYRFYMPSKVLGGENCVLKNPNELIKWGKKPIIVCGKSSAKKSGALDDVLKILGDHKMDYVLFDKVLNNPTPENCFEGGKVAKENKADFVIAIGGGSPLDAAKAVAAYAANDIEMMEIYNTDYKNEPLPIVAIATTAGTGSEVTIYSVLTLASEKNKKSFSTDRVLPKVAFCDPKYTYSLGYDFTASTAIDAFCHAAEAYVKSSSTVVSDMFALKSAKICYDALRELKNYENEEIPHSLRADLMVGSNLAGIAINLVGTSFAHNIGYYATFAYDVPHGYACAYTIADCLEYNARAVPEKISDLFYELGISSFSELSEFMFSFIGNRITLSDEEIDLVAKRSPSTGNCLGSYYAPLEQDIREIMKKRFK